MNFDDLESRLEEAFVLESTRNKWRKIALSMGKMTDKQLSKKFNVTAGAISQARRKLCIAPRNFESVCDRYGAEFVRPEFE